MSRAPVVKAGKLEAGTVPAGRALEVLAAAALEVAAVDRVVRDASARAKARLNLSTPMGRHRK
jgi:hypothetical protein